MELLHGHCSNHCWIYVLIWIVLRARQLTCGPVHFFLLFLSHGRKLASIHFHWWKDWTKIFVFIFVTCSFYPRSALKTNVAGWCHKLGVQNMISIFGKSSGWNSTTLRTISFKLLCAAKQHLYAPDTTYPKHKTSLPAREHFKCQVSLTKSFKNFLLVVQMFSEAFPIYQDIIKIHVP